MCHVKLDLMSHEATNLVKISALNTQVVLKALADVKIAVLINQDP